MMRRMVTVVEEALFEEEVYMSVSYQYCLMKFEATRGTPEQGALTYPPDSLYAKDIPGLPCVVVRIGRSICSVVPVE